ncbi:MAG: UDP-glucose 4-epimerase GalE [Melioribacteraceae bacterium]|nr:UDP-glucose 4-epimerase GalE [Melioribacteraceae bacterium]
MKILVTGGAGYIGSHFVKYLISKGIDVAVLDNLSRGHEEAVPEDVKLYRVDLLNYEELSDAIKESKADAIVHFAAFAYVGESVENPAIYYQNNVIGSINLIKAVNEAGIKKFVFSSTCSLYGNPVKVPISEEESVKPINPYANTKNAIEMVLKDFDNAYGLKSVCLRYFNAAGCDFDGMIGESHEPEPHLIPIVLDAALGKRKSVKVFGDDYKTPDGTCIRDYIHVNDLADAHLKGLEYLFNSGESTIINLGTGTGYSVKEIIDSARKVTGLDIPYEIAERRAGDPDVLVADNKKSKSILGWEPKIGLDEVLSSAFNWQKNKKY